jgi:hypothetical protein
MRHATRLQAIETAGPARQCSRLSLTVLCLLLLDCSGNNAWQQPTVILDTAAGPRTLLSPAPAMPGGAVAPPPGLENAPPSNPVPPVRRDGTYVGTAVPLDTGGGLCIATHQVSGFHVQGNSVRFGGFRGTIDANNGLQMVSRRDWIAGQFDGDTFRGQMDVTGRFDAPGCTFMMTLQRAGT